MLKQNKNRGAGLVTVVAVLAISGILLSGSVFLAFNHYRNAIQREISESELAEIDLCAELICTTLADQEFSEDVFTHAFQNGTLLHLFFASLSESEFENQEDLPAFFQIENDVITFSGFTIENIKTNSENDINAIVATVSYGSSSRSVSFYYINGMWSLDIPEAAE